ncbi:hypothetical protein J0X12_13440 [Sneathiella sp. CAU 1612]|uniref:Lipoprotein n=1 Tax=Sneathiella sedimenti TaxID=2816034 RepID=A0ABS3F7X3_9PROT|nr:hypothetical protein [Sneathiella sedimenti]MBO0334625.1 hypothetical protein [Sneathiella sedimenti]
MFRRYMFLLALILPIAGCAAPEPIGPVTYRHFDSGYQKTDLLLRGSFTGTSTEVYLRAGKSGANLEVCGFYIRRGGNEDSWIVDWLEDAEVTLNGEGIVSAGFINSQYQPDSAKAACVVTATKYQEDQPNGFLTISEGCHSVILFGFRRSTFCFERTSF